MKTVSQVLQSKAGGVLSITPGASVFEALQQMAARNVGALLVMEDGRLRGILSERDYARKVILLGKSSHELAVRDIMSTQVLCVRPESTVDECLALMSGKRVRHLPVVSGGEVIGVLSIGDLVKAVIEEQRATIRHLEGYIYQ
jgi:CBS domain-containing protein